MSRPTIGTDQEFFLRDESGQYIASQKTEIKGTKHNPQDLPGGGTVQKDNVAVEFATPIARNMKDLLKKVKRCLKDTHAIIPEKHELVAEPSASFDEEQLQDPEAQEFGCDADYDAYTASINEPPWCDDPSFRSSGGHIHVGCLNESGKVKKGLEFMVTFEGRLDLVKAMDLFHGVVSTVLDKSEAALNRRKLYGKAGCHRPKEYGVEYRVLSNFWMKSPELVMLMESLTRDAVGLVKAGKLYEILNVVGETDLQNVINNGLVKDAEKIIENYVLPNISGETRDYYEMCLENLPKYRSLKEEWGI